MIKRTNHLHIQAERVNSVWTMEFVLAQQEMAETETEHFVQHIFSTLESPLVSGESPLQREFLGNKTDDERNYAENMFP